MPQMSPMNWIFLCTLFLIIISNLKSFINIYQKNNTQKNLKKNSIQNNIKW